MFCMFLTIYTWQFYIFIISHYILMLIWILGIRTNFCGSIDGQRRPVSEFVYNLVIATVFIFDIVNVKDGPTRLKNSVFYTILILENSFLMVFWWNADVTFMGLDKVAIVITYAVLQGLGLFFLLLYYKKMHPIKNLPDLEIKAQIL